MNAGAVLWHDRCVVATLTGFAVAYEVAGGREVWRQALDGPCAADLTLFRGLVLLHTVASVYLLRPEDGRVVTRWHWPERRIRTAVAAGELVVAEAVPAGGDSVRSAPELLGLRAEGGVAQPPVYAVPRPAYILNLRWSSETGLLYETSRGRLTLLDPGTGAPLVELATDGRGAPGPCHAPDVRDGVLYVLADGGYLYALAHPVPGGARARPAPGGRAGRRLARSEAEVAAVSQTARRPIADPAYWAARLRTALDPHDGRIFERSIGGLRVLDFAEDEARRLGEVRIGTEHVLLGVLKFGYRNAHILSLLAGLLEDDDGPIAEIVRSSGADVRAARQGVAATLTSTAERWAGEANPFNPRELRPAMRVGLALRWAVWEARRRRQTTVDAPHLLLGFVHESEQTDGRARERATVPARVEAGGATVLERAGLDAGAVRAALEARLGPVTRTLP